MVAIGRKQERLDFTIPDFFRTVWVSEGAKDTWEPRIHAIATNWPYVERACLVTGKREGILQSIIPTDLPMVHNWSLEYKVPMVIVGMEGERGLAYGNSSVPYEQGKPFSYRIYFGKDPDAFQASWKEHDQVKVGIMLGYPTCCIASFNIHWVLDGWRDLTYHSYTDQNEKNLMYNNVLLRSLGVRAVSHLPCSVSCKPSCKIGMEVFKVMEQCGHQAELVDWMKSLLSMPMLWSSLHGIAVLTTPLFKLVSATEPLAKVAELHLASDYYPDEGASGNTFPFQHFKTLKVNISKSSDFLDNGFMSRSAMESAHKFIISMLPNRITGMVGNILDLGCGNGRLLLAIQKEHQDTVLHGVDTKDIKALGWNFYRVNIYDFEWEKQYELTTMSVERLFEAREDAAIDLLETIARHSRYLLLSTYNQWMGGFEHIIDKLFNLITIGKDPALGFEAKLLERK